MSILIKGIDMPQNGDRHRITIYDNGDAYIATSNRLYETDRKDVEVVEIPTPHGRLIDANKLEAMMYHEAFETDSDMQKWDSGCWIRYKVFENCMNRLLPDTIIEAEEK